MGLALLPVSGLTVSIPGGAFLGAVVARIECGVLTAVMSARRDAKMDMLAAIAQA